jgi:hypothetical protein
MKWRAAASKSRPKALTRLVLEVFAGWASLSSRGLWGGHALLFQILGLDSPRVDDVHEGADGRVSVG